VNYLEMKTEFSALLNRRDVTQAQKDAWLRQGIERAQRVLRIPAMERSVLFTVPSDWDGLTIPSDYLELIRLKVTLGSGRKVNLTRKSEDEVEAAALHSGDPSIFYRQGGKWIIGPTPTTGSVIRIDYYGEFDGLVEDTDENILSIICPTLALYAGLTFAGKPINDKRGPAWAEAYQTTLDELHEQADDDELSGGAEVAASEAYAWPDDC
jgi:hypothetical protein